VKYHALCEGDDYWISSAKLQRQVLFFFCFPKHSLSIHAYRCDILDKGNITSKNVFKYKKDVEIVPTRDVFNGTGMFSATASMVYRAEFYNDYPEWAKKAPVGDRPLKFVLFSHGPIGYMNIVMSVYRMGVAGSWTQRIQRNHAVEKRTRSQFRSILTEFADWTQKKYHFYVLRASYIYRLSCLKRDLYYCLSHLFRKLF
jgi:hypothetical protein